MLSRPVFGSASKPSRTRICTKWTAHVQKSPTLQYKNLVAQRGENSYGTPRKKVWSMAILSDPYGVVESRVDFECNLGPIGIGPLRMLRMRQMGIRAGNRETVRIALKRSVTPRRYRPMRSPVRMLATMRRHAATYVQAVACTTPPLPNVKFALCSCWAGSGGVSVPIPSPTETSVSSVRTRRARSAAPSKTRSSTPSVSWNGATRLAAVGEPFGAPRVRR